MITTVTTATTTAITSVAAASFALIVILTLIALLVQKEIIGGLEGARLVRFLVRMVLVVAVSTGVAWATHVGLDAVGPDEPSRLWSALVVACVGAVDVGVFLVLARTLRLREVTSVLALVTRR